MGQKVNPNSFRLGINQEWTSYQECDRTSSYSDQFGKDLHIRKLISGIFDSQQGYLCHIFLRRSAKNVRYVVSKFDYRPTHRLEVFVDVYLFQKAFLQSPIILQKVKEDSQWAQDYSIVKENVMQDDVDFNSPQDALISKFVHYWSQMMSHQVKMLIRKQIEKEISSSNLHVNFRVKVQKGSNAMEREHHFLLFAFFSFNPQLIATWMCRLIEKRKGIRELVRKVEKAFWNSRSLLRSSSESYPLGMKICCGGRFLMMDQEKRRHQMARQITYQRGVISLHSLQSMVSYASDQAFTADGLTGVSVWISSSPSSFSS